MSLKILLILLLKNWIFGVLYRICKRNPTGQPRKAVRAFLEGEAEDKTRAMRLQFWIYRAGLYYSNFEYGEFEGDYKLSSLI